MSIQQDEEKSNALSVVRLISIVWRGKWICLGVALVATVGAWFYANSLHNVYKAELTFVSESGGGSSSSSQIAGLAQLAGLSLGSSSGGSGGMSVSTILGSRTLRERVVQSLGLVEVYFPVNPPSDAKVIVASQLQGAIKVTSDPTGVSLLEVRMEDPALAKKVAEQAIIELEGYLIDYNVEKARKEALTLERQIRDQSDRLREAQEALAVFQVKYKALKPEDLMTNNGQIILGLYSQKVQLEVDLKLAEQKYQGDSNTVQELKFRIASVEKQIEESQRSGGLIGVSFKDAPELAIQYQSLFRDVEIAQKIYLTLLASLQQATLASTEARVAVQVVDPPLLPSGRFAPNRNTIVLIGFLVGLFGCAFTLIGIFIGKQLLRQYKLLLAEEKPTVKEA